MTILSPQDPVNLVLETAAGFRTSRILLTGVSLGVFEALAPGALTLEGICERTGTQPRPMRILLDALAAMGLLEKTGPAWSNAPAAAECLVPGRPRFLGDIIRHSDSLWYAWSTLSTVCRTGRRTPKEEISRPFTAEEQTQYFIQGMKNMAGLISPLVLSRLDLAGCRRMLDVGGGPAWYSLEFCRRYPELEAVVFDLSEVARIGRKNILEAGLEGRVRYREGDFLAEPLGEDFDFVYVANIIHIYSAEENRALVAKCAGVLKPGGRLCVMDFFVDDQRTGPLPNVLFAVNMLVNTEAGDTYPASVVQRWLEDAGLTGVGEPIPLDGRSSLLVGVKPA